jgi:hypothetical protein
MSEGSYFSMYFNYACDIFVWGLRIRLCTLLTIFMYSTMILVLRNVESDEINIYMAVLIRREENITSENRCSSCGTSFD